MYLVDISIDPTTPKNRDVTQIEWARLFPGEPPRRVYFTFKRGIPVKVEPDKLAKFLMKKFPTVRVTAEDLQDLIAKVYKLNYNELKAMGLKYGWSLKDVSVTKVKLIHKIHEQLQNFVLPMTPDQYKVHKKVQTEKARSVAKAEAHRVKLQEEAKEKEELRLKEKKQVEKEYEDRKIADRIAAREIKTAKAKKIIEAQKAEEKKADDAIKAKAEEKQKAEDEKLELAKKHEEDLKAEKEKEDEEKKENAEKLDIEKEEKARIEAGLHLISCPFHAGNAPIDSDTKCNCGVIPPAESMSGDTTPIKTELEPKKKSTKTKPK